LLEANFDECSYDVAVFPYYEDPKSIDEYIMIEDDNVFYDYKMQDYDKKEN
jgi:hypothetical protein